MGILSGRQYKIEIVGDVLPAWGDNERQIGFMLQTALSLNMAMLETFRWSNIQFTAIGERFPIPGEKNNHPPQQ